MSTPNADSVTRHVIGASWHVFADDHRWYFTPRSLRQALHRAGFQVVSLATRNIYPPEIMRALRPQTSAAAPRSSAPPSPPVAASYSRLREFSRRSAVGRIGRRLVNTVLTATGSGDTIWLLASRTG